MRKTLVAVSCVILAVLGIGGWQNVTGTSNFGYDSISGYGCNGNYGTSGQALTSGGAGAACTWSTFAPLASPAFTGTPTINSLNAAVTVASGTATLGTAAIASGACATAVSVTATGALTTDAFSWAFNAAPDSSYNVLTIKPYVTSGHVNFVVCNPSAGSVTPVAQTLNWRVAR